MALEVFWASGSTPAWRVLLTLAVKGAPYESRAIRLTRRDQRRPDFLDVNPRGKVPAIRDGAFTLRESLAIMAYLDRRFPDPPLYGATAEEHGRIQCFIHEHEGYFRPPMLGVVRPILYGGPGAIAGKEDDIRAAGAALREEIAALEAALAGRSWLVGDRVSAADIAVYPGIELVLRAAARPSAARFDFGLLPLADRFPAVAAWRARIEAIPGYDATYPPTWREP
jgi:glutathione S-transferase